MCEWGSGNGVEGFTGEGWREGKLGGKPYED